MVTMNTRLLVLSVVPFLTGTATAQEMPAPAPELQKYAPLIGNWRGTGTAQMGPGEPSKWDSHSTYSWALGKFFVQEDTVVRFEGMQKPLAMRVYYGWDAENAHHVAIGVDNDGSVDKHRVEFADDGTMVQFTDSHHEGQRHLQRYSSKIDGDSMTFAIDTIGVLGPSSQPVKGKMTRTDKQAPMALEASAFTATAAAPIVQLGKTSGTYAVKASMVMMPGAPAMDITGQDQVKTLFDGTIVHVHTTGKAAGSPEEYVGELFYGFDAAHDRIRAVYVSNMGEIGEMAGAFSQDGTSFILSSAMRYMGQPCVQRMVMELDENGAPTKAVGHTIIGTAAPFESWNATYTRK